MPKKITRPRPVRRMAVTRIIDRPTPEVVKVLVDNAGRDCNEEMVNNGLLPLATYIINNGWRPSLPLDAIEVQIITKGIYIGRARAKIWEQCQTSITLYQQNQKSNTIKYEIGEKK